MFWNKLHNIAWHEILVFALFFLFDEFSQPYIRSLTSNSYSKFFIILRDPRSHVDVNLIHVL